jgi:hypothetical protein
MFYEKRLSAKTLWAPHFALSIGLKLYKINPLGSISHAIGIAKWNRVLNFFAPFSGAIVWQRQHTF